MLGHESAALTLQNVSELLFYLWSLGDSNP
jgi:hypothetical protein